MNAQFDDNGRVHTFQVSLGPRPDGRIGPPLEAVVDHPEPRHRAIQSRRPGRCRVVYDHVDAEHDTLIYRLAEVL